MKPLIQKLPLNESTSFIAKTFRTPYFEVGWHQHTEYELILFTEGSGMSFVGNYVGEFETGDIYFLGSNLPHTFQKRDSHQITSAVVIQFEESFWGKEFINIPETKQIKQLFDASMYGLKMNDASTEYIKPLMKKLEYASNLERIILLCECLQAIVSYQEYSTLSTQEVKQMDKKDREIIDNVFQFTINNFKEQVTLEQVAGILAQRPFPRHF